MKINKKRQEIVREYSFHKTVSIEPKFLKRRLALIIRDPLAIEAVKEANKLPLPINEYPPKIQDLLAELKKKWNAMLLFTRDQKYRYALGGQPYDQWIDPEGIMPLVMHMEQGLEERLADLLVVSRTFEPIRFHRVYASEEGEDPSRSPISQYRFAGDDRLFIEIDLNLIDSNDAKFIKNTVWSIAKRYLAKRKEEGRKKRILDEPEELYFIYDCREETFQNYLRWYDIHTKEMLSFRLIARAEEIRKGNIQTAERFSERIRNTRFKVGRPVKGEDRVEKGVKLIWAAIHRESYSPKKIQPFIEEWRCAEHGKNYCAKCKQCISIYERFDRIYSMSRGFIPSTEPKRLSKLQDMILLKREGKLAEKPSRKIEEE